MTSKRGFSLTKATKFAAILPLVVLSFLGDSAISIAADELAVLDNASLGAGLIDTATLPERHSTRQMLKGKVGVLVAEVAGPGTCNAAKIEERELIVGFNGWRIETLDDLLVAFADVAPGMLCEFEVQYIVEVSSVQKYTDKTLKRSGPAKSFRQTALDSVSLEMDKVTRDSWVQHRRLAADLSIDNGVSFSPHFMVKNGKAAPLRIRTGLTRESIFRFDAISVRAGDSLVSLPVDVSTLAIKFDGGSSRCHLDRVVDAKWLEALTAIAKSPTAIVRFENSQQNESFDSELESGRTRAIRDILVAYRHYGGDCDLQWYVDQIRERREKTSLLAKTHTLKKRESPVAIVSDPAKTVSPEDAASKSLSLAKQLAFKGNVAAANKRFAEIVEKYPDTPAGKEAAGLLKQMK